MNNYAQNWIRLGSLVGDWMLARNAGDPTPSPATGLMVTGMIGRPPLSFTGRRPGTSPR